MMKDRVLAWYNKTKEGSSKTAHWKHRRPNHLFFDREGVSEGQYGMVQKEETSSILGRCQRAFEEIQKDRKNNRYVNLEKWPVKLTLLVDTK